MGKVVAVAIVLLSTLIFAQTGQLQPIKPNIPFTPLLSTKVQEVDVLGPYGSVW